MNAEKVVHEFIRSVDNSHRFGRVLHRYIKEPKEKPHKIFMLDDLKEMGKSRLKDIASRTGQSPQNLCMLYNEFEKKGFITREVDPADRRNTYYSITEKGVKHVDKNKNKAKKVIEMFFSTLSDDDLDILKKNLTKSNEIIEKILAKLP